ncbi:MAG: exodeoxyribonuclease III [Deltaproteobacteria bacterium]|nr:exodeoxyribonuclease III [Deltaproteobacteria bacterium]
MRIATWNVNSLNARLEFVLGWLAERRPDAVCFQELKLTNEAFPYAALEAAGYHAVVHGQKSWNGVAVLSREPAACVQVGLPGAEAAGARLVTATLGEWTVSSVYVPNGKTLVHADFQLKLGFLARLRDHIASSVDRGKPYLLGGDFNVAHTDLDSYDPDGLREAIFHTAPERAAIDALLELGLVDLQRTLEPGARSFSWWDYRGGSFHKNEGLRIDLLLGSVTTRSRVSKVWVDRDYRKKKGELTPSDHAPVIADFA